MIRSLKNCKYKGKNMLETTVTAKNCLLRIKQLKLS